MFSRMAAVLSGSERPTVIPVSYDFKCRTINAHHYPEGTLSALSRVCCGVKTFMMSGVVWTALPWKRKGFPEM